GGGVRGEGVGEVGREVALQRGLAEVQYVGGGVAEVDVGVAVDRQRGRAAQRHRVGVRPAGDTQEPFHRAVIDAQRVGAVAEVGADVARRAEARQVDGDGV